MDNFPPLPPRSNKFHTFKHIHRQTSITLTYQIPNVEKMTIDQMSANMKDVCGQDVSRQDVFDKMS